MRPIRPLSVFFPFSFILQLNGLDCPISDDWAERKAWVELISGPLCEQLGIGEQSKRDERERWMRGKGRGKVFIDQARGQLLDPSWRWLAPSPNSLMLPHLPSFRINQSTRNVPHGL